MMNVKLKALDVKCNAKCPTCGKTCDDHDHYLNSSDKIVHAHYVGDSLKSHAWVET